MKARLTRTAIVLFILALAGAGGWALLQHFAVPFQGSQAAASSPILHSSDYPAVPADAKIRRLVEQARRDFFIAPISGLPRWHLIFSDARARGREVYLFFTPDVSESVVVYCGTPDDGRLHWKMVLLVDA